MTTTGWPSGSPTLALPVDGAGTYPGDDWVTARGVEPAADGSGWSLILVDGEQTLVIGCGDGQWQRTAARPAPTAYSSSRPRAGGPIPTRSWPTWS